jgi:hypothetical protein
MRPLKSLSAAVNKIKGAKKQTGAFHAAPPESYIFLPSSNSADTNPVFLVLDR